jgi:hypothetical protein
MGKSKEGKIEHPAYNEEDLEIVTPEELEEAKELAGVTSHEEALKRLAKIEGCEKIYEKLADLKYGDIVRVKLNDEEQHHYYYFNGIPKFKVILIDIFKGSSSDENCRKEVRFEDIEDISIETDQKVLDEIKVKVGNNVDETYSGKIWECEGPFKDGSRIIDFRDDFNEIVWRVIDARGRVIVDSDNVQYEYQDKRLYRLIDELRAGKTLEEFKREESERKGAKKK